MKNNTKYKVFVFMLMVALVLIGATITGCGDNGEVVDEQVDDDEVIELVWAQIMAAGGPEEVGALHFKELVEERSNGQIEVSIFLGASLGNELENLEQIGDGEVAVTLLGEAGTSTVAGDVFPMFVPFVFTDLDDVVEALDGRIGELMAEKISERAGGRLVGYQMRGARQLTANRPIYTPDDLSGMNLRVPEISEWVDVWETLGASVSPIAWPEVYGALQTGVIDGQENPHHLHYVENLYEVQDYTMLTGHVQAIWYWIVSEAYLEKLTDEQQEIVIQAAKDAAEYAHQVAAEDDERYKGLLEEKGMEFIEPDMEAFIEKAQPAISEIAITWNEEIVDEVARITGISFE